MGARQRDDTRERTPRRYQRIWELIAANTSEQPVKVDCSGPFQRTLIQAVRKEKSIANKMRKNVDAVSYGELIVRIEGKSVYFSLTYNGDMI